MLPHLGYIRVGDLCRIDDMTAPAPMTRNGMVRLAGVIERASLIGSDCCWTISV